MGYFLDINNNEDLRAKNTAQINAANGKTGHSYAGVILSQLAPSIFMGVLNKIESSQDGKGGSDSKNLSVDEQKKSLEKQLDKALSAVGVNDVNSINTAIEDQNTKVTNANNKIQAFRNSITDNSQKIQTLEAQKVSGTNLSEEDNANNQKFQSEIDKLTKEIDQAKKDVKQAEKEYANEVKALQEMSVNADKAKNINIQLQNLKAIDKTDKTTPQYDVKQEVTDLSAFNKAREKFLKKPSKETAIALEEAFKSVDSDKTKDAYNKYLKASVNRWKNSTN